MRVVIRRESHPFGYLVCLSMTSDESLRLVREGGGEIIKGSTDAGHAVIRDPVGVS